MGTLDIWMVAAALAAAALLASLRLSIPTPGERSRLARALDLASHPTWLVPLIGAMALVLGLMMSGQISPWPPQAGAQFAGRFGHWAGVTGFLTVLVVDMWLLWTPSMVARRYAEPERRGTMQMLPVLNLAFGAIFIAAIALIQHRA